MEAVFIIDREFTDLSSAWEMIGVIVRGTGSSEETYSEPFRLALQGAATLDWTPSVAPLEIGWHYRGAADGEYLRQLSTQMQALQENGLTYKIRPAAFGEAHAHEIRGHDREEPYLVMPVEDSTHHVARFLQGYWKPLLSHAFRPDREAEAILRGFQEHCETHLRGERPFEASASKSSSVSWTPRRGEVGRHEILREIEIGQQPTDRVALLRLLSALHGATAIATNELFLQFFAPQATNPPLLIQPKHLLEKTFVFSRLRFEQISNLLEQISSRSPALEVCDVFALIEQPRAVLGSPCSVTYTLRRTRSGVYEVRANPSWTSETVEPEEAVLDMERATEASWARIV